MKAVLSATATSSVGTSLPSTAVTCGSLRRQRLRHRADGEARLQAGEIGELGHEGAVHKHDAAAFDRGERRAGVLGARLGGDVGDTGERLGIAHERAQIGVFPLLHAPVRQAGRLEALEGVLAQRRNRTGARKRGLHGSEIRRQPGLGRSLDRSDLGVHDRLTPPLPGIARSRWPRAQAPAPCRRCARCGRARARAPRPARCS